MSYFMRHGHKHHIKGRHIAILPAFLFGVMLGSEITKWLT